MVKTQIVHIGSRKIAWSGVGEFTIPALGNGVAKPGEAVGITDATGKVVGTDVGASELFLGFLDDLESVAVNTAIPDGIPCRIIVPQSAHIYSIWITDPGGAVTSGNSHVLSATAGNFVGAASASHNVAGARVTNVDPLENTDRVMKGLWK